MCSGWPGGSRDYDRLVKVTRTGGGVRVIVVYVRKWLRINQIRRLTVCRGEPGALEEAADRDPKRSQIGGA